MHLKNVPRKLNSREGHVSRISAIHISKKRKYEHCQITIRLDSHVTDGMIFDAHLGSLYNGAHHNSVALVAALSLL